MHIDNNEIRSERFDHLDQMSFKLIDVDHTSENAREWSLRKHFIETYMLLFVASGQGWLMADGNFIELRSGGLYMGFPGQLVEADVRSLDERGVYHMSFDVMYSSEQNGQGVLDIMKQLLRYEVNGEVTSASPVAVGVLCQMIYHHTLKKDGLQRYYGQIRFQELLYTMFYDGACAEGTDLASLIEHVKAYLEQNYTNKITIEELAIVARMSSRHFMRLFKRRYGCSPMDYLTIYRIKQAQILMRNDHNYRLKDVASYVGYQDETYFRRKFKQISGIPPAAFIRNSKQKIAAVHPLSIGTLLALQIIPCAAPASHPWTYYYRRKYETDKVMPLAEVETIWLEQLRLVNPDYIITLQTEMSAALHSQLRAIAPVCIIPYKKGDWREHLRFLAHFLDRSDIAEVWLQRYEEKVALVKQQLAVTIQKDRLLVLKIYGEALQVLGPSSIASVFYVDMQMDGPEEIEKYWEQSKVTMGQLSTLNIERILLIVGEDETSRQTWASLRKSDEWGGITAVQNGRLDMLMSSVLLDYTAFTHELMLDEILKLWQDRP
ncbi:AraC family transcriptional regulator [Paenibacillus sp. QZ-Y1]|uniref:AraC family transcriptional regulator n=1 Tax=Paenibacillus sp. QZ-Y1 TaxID=3414511 RepID=UPI003F7925FB